MGQSFLLLWNAIEGFRYASVSLCFFDVVNLMSIAVWHKKYLTRNPFYRDFFSTVSKELVNGGDDKTRWIIPHLISASSIWESVVARGLSARKNRNFLVLEIQNSVPFVTNRAARWKEKKLRFYYITKRFREKIWVKSHSDCKHMLFTNSFKIMLSSRTFISRVVVMCRVLSEPFIKDTRLSRFLPLAPYPFRWT